MFLDCGSRGSEVCCPASNALWFLWPSRDSSTGGCWVTSHFACKFDGAVGLMFWCLTRNVLFQRSQLGQRGNGNTPQLFIVVQCRTCLHVSRSPCDREPQRYRCWQSAVFLRFWRHLTSSSSALHGNSIKVRKYVCYWLSNVLTRCSDVAVERDINNFECVDGCLDFLLPVHAAETVWVWRDRVRF